MTELVEVDYSVDENNIENRKLIQYYERENLEYEKEREEKRTQKTELNQEQIENQIEVQTKQTYMDPEYFIIKFNDESSIDIILTTKEINISQEKFQENEEILNVKQTLS